VSIHCQSILKQSKCHFTINHYCHQDKLEPMFALRTHSLPIATGSGQTTTHYSSSYLCISKLPNYQIWFTQISPLSHPDSYNTLYQDRLSGQSNTSPKLRWTGNSPIWGEITVPTGVSSTYMTTPHTQIWLSKSTSTNTVLQHYVPPQRHARTRERSTTWSTIIYTSNC